MYHQPVVESASLPSSISDFLNIPAPLAFPNKAKENNYFRNVRRRNARHRLKLVGGAEISTEVEVDFEPGPMAGLKFKSTIPSKTM